MDNKTLKMAEFYEQCQQNGYTDMKDEKQSLKAKVIATDLGLKYGKITDFYAKAEKAYKQVNEEKERERQQQEERRKQHRELAAKRAVNGELLVTMSDSQTSSEKGTVLRVYLRPDKSVYTTVDNGNKIEGAPTIEAKESGVILSTYHPSQLVYTGATVGGVTTGGFHHTQDSISSHLNKTGKGFLLATIGEHKVYLLRITMSEKTRGIFKRDAAFRKLTDSNGGIAGYNTAPSNWASIYSQGAPYAKDIGMQMSMLSAAADEKSLSFASCAEIADLLNRVVYAHFPPLDSELYEKACVLEKNSVISEIEEALEIFEKIADYKDSAKKAKALRPRYQALLQEEKEKTIIRKEKDKKKTIICVIIIAFSVVVFTLVGLASIHSSATARAHDIVDNQSLPNGQIMYFGDLYPSVYREKNFGTSGFVSPVRVITIIDQEKQTLNCVEYDWVHKTDAEWNYKETTYHYEIQVVGLGKVCIVFGDYSGEITKEGKIKTISDGENIFSRPVGS